MLYYLSKKSSHLNLFTPLPWVTWVTNMRYDHIFWLRGVLVGEGIAYSWSQGHNKNGIIWDLFL